MAESLRRVEQVREMEGTVKRDSGAWCTAAARTLDNSQIPELEDSRGLEGALQIVMTLMGSFGDAHCCAALQVSCSAPL